MIIGPGCSVGAVLTAETAPFYSLTQVVICIVAYCTTIVAEEWSRCIVQILVKTLLDHAVFLYIMFVVASQLE